MDRRLIELLNRHEQQDNEKLTGGLEQAVIRELENAGELISRMKEAGFAVDPSADDYFDIPVDFVRKVDGFEIRKHTRSVVPYFHSHSYYELIYVYKGSLLQYLNRRFDKKVLGERELCLLAPGSFHALLRPGEKDIVLKISLPEQMLDAVAAKVNISGGIARGSISYFKADSLRFESFISGMLEELVYGRDNMDTAIENYLTLAFIELFRGADTISDYQLLELAENYIKTHFASPTLVGLSDSLGYSAGHTGRLIREKLGMTFQQLLSKIRMDTAAAKLSETDCPVEQIAGELGYQSVSGFYKQFDRTFGVSPAKYRRH